MVAERNNLVGLAKIPRNFMLYDCVVAEILKLQRQNYKVAIEVKDSCVYIVVHVNSRNVLKELENLGIKFTFG